jgi:hypothetical protein
MSPISDFSVPISLLRLNSGIHMKGIYIPLIQQGLNTQNIRTNIEHTTL